MTRGWLNACLVLSAIAAGISLYLYQQRAELFPAQVATHFDLHGQPDSWTAREDMFWPLMGMPLVMFGMSLLSVVLPWISPAKFKVDANARVYGYVMFLIVVLFGYLQVVMVLTFMDAGGDFLRFYLGGMFLFFALLGNVLGQVPRNFWIGVRTPWTLASNIVWVKTHRLSAWLFVAGGVAGMLLVWLDASPFLYIAVLGVAVVTPVVYSLVLYKRLEKTGELAAEQQA
jgi:uncharacterized membrane protein